MPKLRLSPEIQCHPTWLEKDGAVENVAPEKLPVSPELAAALNEWRDRWDATYDMDDPMNSGFSSDAEEQKFRQDGESLAARLESELGPDWVVQLRLS
ncbi:hypothetical protein [Actinacidiphila acididurans]|uniref:Uncharacterized protein n=1 Tax=Actinacidiphila acididurans TaxID=2784346 RepID=A0ABS2U2Z1_9ACTN|nr:hypothetical protein [Actinacidiphila acididurans]MBM9508523.1 hypothetical protein [Actinacidiphila acididurans]